MSELLRKMSEGSCGERKNRPRERLWRHAAYSYKIIERQMTPITLIYTDQNKMDNRICENPSHPCHQCAIALACLVPARPG